MSSVEVASRLALSRVEAASRFGSSLLTFLVLSSFWVGEGESELENKQRKPTLLLDATADCLSDSLSAPSLSVHWELSSWSNALSSEISLSPLGDLGVTHNERCHGARKWVRPDLGVLVLVEEHNVGVRSESIDTNIAAGELGTST